MELRGSDRGHCSGFFQGAVGGRGAAGGVFEEAAEGIDGGEVQFIGHLGHAGALSQHFLGIRQPLLIIISYDGGAGIVGKGTGEVIAAIMELLLQGIQRNNIFIVIIDKLLQHGGNIRFRGGLLIVGQVIPDHHLQQCQHFLLQLQLVQLVFAEIIGNDGEHKLPEGGHIRNFQQRADAGVSEQIRLDPCPFFRREMGRILEGYIGFLAVGAVTQVKMDMGLADGGVLQAFQAVGLARAQEDHIAFVAHIRLVLHGQQKAAGFQENDLIVEDDAAADLEGGAQIGAGRVTDKGRKCVQIHGAPSSARSVK